MSVLIIPFHIISLEQYRISHTPTCGCNKIGEKLLQRDIAYIYCKNASLWVLNSVL